MKLSLITSSLITLGVAVPVLQGRTQPADLRSPVLVVKRVSEPAIEAPGLEKRAGTAPRLNLAANGGGRRVHEREELEVVDGSESALEAPGLEKRAGTAPRLNLAANGGGRRVHKREELEVVDGSESALEAPGLEKRVGTAPRLNLAANGGGRRVHKREELEVVDESESTLEARGQGSRQHNDRNNGFPGNHNFGHQGVKDSKGGRFQGGQFPGNQFNRNNPSAESQIANVQINGGQNNGGRTIQVTMGGRPETVNGPISSLETDKGSCLAFPRNSNSGVDFSAGSPFGRNGVGPVIAEVELFLWCF